MSHALELKDVRKRFGQSDIIRGASFALAKGERLGRTAPANRPCSTWCPGPSASAAATSCSTAPASSA